MAENSLIPKELRDKADAEWQAGVFDVEKGMIRKFAHLKEDEIDNLQQLVNERYALIKGLSDTSK